MNKKQKEKDTIAILNSFSNSDKEIPVYIRKIEKKNTSDALIKKKHGLLLWKMKDVCVIL